MEFFRQVPVRSSEGALRERIELASLPDFCASIGNVEPTEPGQGQIFCLWGEFLIRRSPITGGLRFELADCPNGLQWTITTGFPPEPDQVIVHASINRPSQSDELVESIDEFLDDWQQGLIDVLG